MEPRIQYAKTADGVSIAFWTLGEGTPLVVMPPSVLASHVQLEWQWPEWRRWYEGLAEGRKVVRYDGRGGGLSDRDVADFSLEARVLDLEAVVDRLGLDRSVLVAAGTVGPTAIAYAVRHPQRVSHLLLWCTYARLRDMAAAVRAIDGLADTDWFVYTESMAHYLLGWPEGEMARRGAAFMRECVTPDTFPLVAAALRETDVTELLPEVKSPTLVLHRRQIPYLSVDMAKRLASAIPDARLVLLEGTTPLPWVDAEQLEMAIDEFLGEGEAQVAGPEPPAPGGLRTVFFTDIVGHTEMMSRLGDERGRVVLREHERITREVLKEHGGSEVKTMGDGFMASFASVIKAVECAIALQRAFAAWNADVGAQHAAPLHVRCGLNAGEPIDEEGDLFGASVILAARIAAAAQGGEILTANVVRELAEGKGFLFADRGEAVLRGFDNPVRLFEVRWRE